MSDRELLELAAKAAGFVAEWRDWTTGRMAEFRTIKYTKHEGFWVNDVLWNPLADDGDALRLAVKLGIEVLPDREINEACTEFCVHRPDLIFLGTREKFSNDEMAATRRAIVRAAAEIGRQMQEGGAA